MPALKVANLFTDLEILKEAQKLCGEVLSADPNLKRAENRLIYARIKALLRRSGRSTSDSASDKITAGGITINTSLREVSRDGRPIELTLKEYELLLYLLKNRARVVSREELLTKVWGIDFVGETRTLDMHIGTLRKKLSDDAENAHLIKTVRGVGYRFIGE